MSYTDYLLRRLELIRDLAVLERQKPPAPVEPPQSIYARTMNQWDARA